MSRLLILEDMPDAGGFVLVEGYHCSCYGFDDCCWDATELTLEELKKVLDQNDWDDLRKKAKEFINNY